MNMLENTDETLSDRMEGLCITALGQPVQATAQQLLAARASVLQSPLRDLQQSASGMLMLNLPFERRSVEAWLAGPVFTSGNVDWQGMQEAIQARPA
jgi:hypothetical protein